MKLNKIMLLSMITTGTIIAAPNEFIESPNQNTIGKIGNFSTFTTPIDNGDGTYTVDFTGNDTNDFRINYSKLDVGSNSIHLYNANKVTHPEYGFIDNLLKKSNSIGINYSFIRDNSIWVPDFEGAVPTQTLTDGGTVSLFGMTFNVTKRVKSNIYNTHTITLSNKINSQTTYVSFDIDENHQTYNVYSNIKVKLKENINNIGELSFNIAGKIHNIGGNTKLSESDIYINKLTPMIDSDFKEISISANNDFFVGIKDDGTLWATGENGNGELGLGDTTNRTTMEQVGVDTKWSKVYHSFNSIIAVKTDGTLWGWGENPTDIYGLGDTVDRLIPTQVGVATDWSTAYINLAESAFVGLKTNGELWDIINTTQFLNLWKEIGAVGYGLMTNGELRNYKTDTQIGTSTNWDRISGKSGANIISKTNGQLWGFGQNFNGELGIGIQNIQPTPIQIGTDTNWADFKLGETNAFGFKTNGELWAWGDNSNGQLGLNSYENQLSPIKVGTSTAWKGVKYIGNKVSFVTKTDGRTFATGTDKINIIKDTSEDLKPSIFVDENVQNFYDIGGGTILYIKTNGTINGYGDNSNGELGQGDKVEKSTKVQLGVDTDWESMKANNDSVLAIKEDGTLWGWGANSSGYLGVGDTSERLTPTQIGVATDWKEVVLGAEHALAIKDDGTLWAWGENYEGELGNGASGTTELAPIQVGVATDWKKIYAGEFYSFAIKTNNTLWAWGYNDQGQLGVGNTVDRTSPTQVGVATNWEEVSLFPNNGSYAIARQSDNTIWSWGANDIGELGLGNTTPTNSPLQIGADADWSGISMGYYFAYALKEDGSIWSWGENNNGQLGTGDFVIKLSPTQVTTSNLYKKVFTTSNKGYPMVR